jgi:hypothetical protein
MKESSNKRPTWVKDVEHTPDGTLLVVEGVDGKRRGVRIPSRSIHEPRIRRHRHAKGMTSV